MHSPKLYFGNVHHSRLRPERNSFNYGVYFLRLPMRSMAVSQTSIRLFSHNCFNLLSFHDCDHGDGQQPLVQWIDSILSKEGIDDADGEIWLQTFPRVLGYVFNPVSFWFCHRSDGALRAVLCEVSNTFGERHCYLLDKNVPIEEGDELEALKVFHVSPFCKVEGGYRFQFRGIRQQNGYKILARIDYHDSKGTLLLTSITGSPCILTNRAVVRALLRFPLMTFMVIARIHWQALRLWIKRVPFYRKPPLSFEEISK